MRCYAFVLFFISFALTTTAFAQLKSSKVSCPAFEVDILNGKVSGLKPDRTSNEITGKFPCYTSKTDENSSSKCGGMIVYKDKDITFFTGRNYVEIGPAFKGKMSITMLGTKRGSLNKVLGTPKIKDATWDAYQTGYGCLVLYYGADNKVKKIQFSTYGTDTIQLCE
ncbi:hypothetical protein [Pseudobacter ginsenosidimutans]|jgi:hypothetical protein|uniref:Uncharacterized protein n=1 Tax=Pseudobacter ginsenosidimutans TaxID=661488 RepID=A0A4Q7M9M1_9BACT|nr:hypothetical protein [Pseudobacter ginsenosidimutans]QEC42556.1 hypothetical protein FSB84_12950 [Pseudobacter ginsenosidimutans]RZS63957.1 hypothetical protein EV199_6057 [Pseudobacter ginsenosidimutans]